MNTIKRAVLSANNLRGIKRGLLLLAGALAFALPFITKSMAADTSFCKVFCIFGWIGLSVLFVTVFDFEKSLKRVLCSLFCFFFLFYFFVYSWFINLYPLDFAGLGNAESVGVIIIAETVIPFLHGVLMSAGVFLGYLAAKQTKNDFARAALVSFGYVIGEYLQSVGVFAFPWARLFVGQTVFPSLLQSASLFGSYFITFIMVLVNALLAFSLVNVKDKNKKCIVYVAAAVCIFAFNLVFGIVRINYADCHKGRTLDALVLQGNIPSGEKWSGDVDEESIYFELAKTANDGKFDIAVMPETAFPVTLYHDDGYLSSHEDTLVEISKTLDAVLFAGAFSKQDGKSYNSIFAIKPDGEILPPYNKYNIVPFGEFLPYRNIIEKLVPSLAEINMLSSDISRGNTFDPIETNAGKAACLVCFDSIFPETARKQIKNGGEFIVISTNDSWYKESSAIYQHADHAIIRAIENNVPVIRSANTGISRIIDSCGRVVAETKVNERANIQAKVCIPKVKTIYTVTGDIIVPAAFVLVFFFLAYGIITHKNTSRKQREVRK